MKKDSFTSELEYYTRNQREKLETVGTFKNGKIRSEYIFQHVIQQTYNRKKLFYPAGASYYENQIKKLCPEYDIVLVCQVVMPNHIHEIFIAKDIKKLSEMRAIACRTTARFMKKELREKGFEVPSGIFAPDPGYVAITDRPQLLRTMKYIRDNDVYLQKTPENGKQNKAPYSCFEHWKLGHYKYYFVNGLEALFGITAKELVELLDSDVESVRLFAERFETSEYRKKDEAIFRKKEE